MLVPANPKIYHIVHIDRLSSIIANGRLWCDAKINQHSTSGTTIGMDSIKARRLNKTLNSHRGLHVGDCVPFYFCPRSVMLYVIHQANHPGLGYFGGQVPIVHLEADLRRTVTWANRKKRRWAFTTSNAGSYFFEDYSDLARLHKVDWHAVRANQWQDCKEGKQAEFLVDHSFPWKLVSRIGLCSPRVYQQAVAALGAADHKPCVEVRKEWYY